jgi:hypothetical protein
MCSAFRFGFESERRRQCRWGGRAKYLNGLKPTLKPSERLEAQTRQVPDLGAG